MALLLSFLIINWILKGVLWYITSGTSFTFKAIGRLKIDLGEWTPSETWNPDSPVELLHFKTI